VLDFGDVTSAAAFERLFRTVLLRGAFVAAQMDGRLVPRRFAIDVRGGERPGRYDDVGDAARALRRDDGLFYARIDLGVGEIVGDRARAIACVSEELPTNFERTWNTPRGYGPFRLVRFTRLSGSTC
jgi:hypothetical protein